MAAKKKPYTVRYRKDTKSWQADVFAGGKRHKKLFHQRADAERWAAGIRADFLRQVTGLQTPVETPTFGSVAALFVRDSEALLEKKTIAYYRDLLRPATQVMGTIPIGTLARGDVGKYISERAREVSSTNAAKSLGAIQRVLRWAITHDIIDTSPVLSLKKPAAAPKYKIENYAANELARVLTSAKSWKARGILLLAFHSGLRLREIQYFALDWLDLSTGTIVIPSWAQFRPKNKKPRSVPLTPELEAWAADWPKGREFLLDGKRDAQQIRRVLWKASKAAGRRVTAHNLRHAFASHLAAAAVPLAELQQVLGHRQVSTTAIYVHATPGHLERVRKAIKSRDTFGTHRGKKQPLSETPGSSQKGIEPS